MLECNSRNSQAIRPKTASRIATRHVIANQTTHVPSCRNNAAHDSGTLFGSARYWSSNASKYAALDAFKKSSRIALFGVGAGAFVAIGAAARSAHGEDTLDDVDVFIDPKPRARRTARVVNVRGAPIALTPEPLAPRVDADTDADARSSAVRAARRRILAVIIIAHARVADACSRSRVDDWRGAVLGNYFYVKTLTRKE